MRINQNIAAMNAYRNLSVTQGQQSKSLERLSSGFRINRAADDAAGLAISEKLRSQVKGLNQAVENAQNGVSLLQTAEGALNETHSILQRMRELAVQGANDTNTTEDRDQIQEEVGALIEELDSIGTNTQFNSMDLLNGDFATTGLSFQVGANANQTISITVNAAASESLFGTGAAADGTKTVGAGAAIATTIDVTGTPANGTDPAAVGYVAATPPKFDKALETLDKAIGKVSESRSNLGAVQNRLEHTVNNLNVASENLAASESRIRDTDMAKEMMSFTRSQILSQAGTAMLAQANQASQGVLSLLR